MSKDLKIEAFPISDFVRRYKWDENLFDIESVILCQSREQSEAHPLLKKVFALDGVSKISLSSFEMKVMTHKNVDWDYHSKEIAQYLRDPEIQSQPILEELLVPKKESVTSQSSGSDTEGIKKIQSIIDEQVTPALASHGGSVKISDYRQGVLSLSFQGGCQGCSQASATLRNGIEKLLKEQAPEIKQIVDATEHELGENPYFA